MSYSNPVGGAGPASTPFATALPGTKLQIKRSAVLNKVPTATDTEFGELIINYNAGSAALYTRGSDDSLRQLGGVYINNTSPANPVEGQWWWDADDEILYLRNAGAWITVSEAFDITAASIDDLSDVDLSGISNGDLLQWNGSEFVAVTPSSISVDVDLGYTAAADKGTVTNSAGDDAEIPLATGTNAGLSLNNYTTTEKNKLTGIEDGANVNVNADWNASSGDAQILNKPTLFSGDYDDLTNKPDIPDATSDLINDGDGTNPFATTDQLFSGDYDDLTNKPDIPDELSDLNDVDTSGATSGQLLRYNGTSWEPGSPGAVSVDLGYTPAADKGTVTNDAGSDAEIPLATGTNAGLSLHNYSQAEKDKLDGLPDPGAITDGTVTSVDSGNGLTGGPITEAGTLSVQADGDTITVGAAGIKVTDGKFAEPGDIPDVSNYLPLAGGEMSGSVTTPEQTVTSIAFDLSAGPYWLIPGGIDVPDPTNAVAGMSGLIRFTAAPTSWGSAFQFAGGTPVAPTKLPAVSPFYVQAAGSIYVGPAVEELI